MSIVPILNMLGSVAAYPMGEWLGRKKVFIFKTSWTRQYSLWNTKYALVCQKWYSSQFISGSHSLHTSQHHRFWDHPLQVIVNNKLIIFSAMRLPYLLVEEASAVLGLALVS